jgi:anti-sigma factor RsiW
MNPKHDQLSSMLKKHAQDLIFKMPADLQERLLNNVEKNNRKAHSFFSMPLNLKLATSFALGLVIAAIGFTQFSSVPSNEELLIQEIVSGHVRSMMVSHLSDVISTDQHTVKPWFEGKLDFAPSVKDLTESGFPLVGGRLDYIDSRPVAALNYQRGKHMINVFEWPTSQVSTTLPKLITRRGYQLYHWTKNGMNFWAISDLNAADLQKFVESL